MLNMEAIQFTNIDDLMTLIQSKYDKDRQEFVKLAVKEIGLTHIRYMNELKTFPFLLNYDTDTHELKYSSFTDKERYMTDINALKHSFDQVIEQVTELVKSDKITALLTDDNGYLIESVDGSYNVEINIIKSK